MLSEQCLPLCCSYIGQIGDVVVGRIIQVGQRRWKVDTKSKLDSVLMLSSVNLPGGELVCVQHLHVYKLYSVLLLIVVTSVKIRLCHLKFVFFVNSG